MEFEEQFCKTVSTNFVQLRNENVDPKIGRVHGLHWHMSKNILVSK